MSLDRSFSLDSYFQSTQPQNASYWPLHQNLVSLLVESSSTPSDWLIYRQSSGTDSIRLVVSRRVNPTHMPSAPTHLSKLICKAKVVSHDLTGYELGQLINWTEKWISCRKLPCQWVQVQICHQQSKDRLTISPLGECPYSQKGSITHHWSEGKQTYENLRQMEARKKKCFISHLTEILCHEWSELFGWKTPYTLSASLQQNWRYESFHSSDYTEENFRTLLG